VYVDCPSGHLPKDLVDLEASMGHDGDGAGACADRLCGDVQLQRGGALAAFDERQGKITVAASGIRPGFFLFDSRSRRLAVFATDINLHIVRNFQSKNPSNCFPKIPEE
jgi:hypothetical protein